MIKRTTLEIDPELVERAGRALGCTTMRATIEEALRRAIRAAEDADAARAARQLLFFDSIETIVELDVLDSDEMWR